MTGQSMLKPDVNPVSPGDLPEADHFKLDNNVPVYSFYAGTEEIVRIEFIFNAGNIMENMPLLASMTNSMLSEGTSNFSSNTINRQLDYYGVFYNLYTDKDTAGLIIYALKKHIKKIFELVVEMLFFPVFPAF